MELSPQAEPPVRHDDSEYLRSGESKTEGLIRWFTEHERELYAYARRYLGSAEDAEEVLQETAVLILRKGDSFRNESPIKPWVYAVLTNTCINYHRKKKRSRHVLPLQEMLSGQDSDVHSFGAHAVSKEKDPLEQLVAKEWSEMLQKELCALPAERQDSLALRIAGKKYKDIARIIGVPLGTVKSRIHAAHMSLALVLGIDIKKKAKNNTAA